MKHKKTKPNIFIAFIAHTLSLAVLLSGVHAKDLSAMSYTSAKNTRNNIALKVKKTTSIDDNSVKIDSHAHNHVDHQTSKSIIKVFGDQTNSQADARSLRKSQFGKNTSNTENRFKFWLWPAWS